MQGTAGEYFLVDGDISATIDSDSKDNSFADDLGEEFEVTHMTIDDELLSPPPTMGTPIVSEDELFPDRYHKQPAGGSGKVCYVVFNGLSPGVHYNW